MANLKFNPNLLICEYFDKITNLIDVHTEEQLEKYTESDFIDKPFEYKFKDLAKRYDLSVKELNGNFFRFHAGHEDESSLNEVNKADYDLTNQPKMEIQSGTVRVRDYLSATRDELIGHIKKYEEQALVRYQEIKDDVLKSIQTIEDRETQIDEFKRRLFANKHIGVFQIEELISRINDDDGGVEDDDEHDYGHDETVINKSPFRLYLVVLDFYLDRSDQNFLR